LEPADHKIANGLLELGCPVESRGHGLLVQGGPAHKQLEDFILLGAGEALVRAVSASEPSLDRLLELIDRDDLGTDDRDRIRRHGSLGRRWTFTRVTAGDRHGAKEQQPKAASGP